MTGGLVCLVWLWPWAGMAARCLSRGVACAEVVDEVPPRLLCACAAEMTRGERAMLDLKPEYAFQHKDSGIPLPKGVRPEAPVVADVTVRLLLLCCY